MSSRARLGCSLDISYKRSDMLCEVASPTFGKSLVERLNNTLRSDCLYTEMAS